MNTFDKVPITCLEDVVGAFNMNNQNLYSCLDGLSKATAKLSAQNKKLTIVCVGLCVGLYLTSKRTRTLELKVHNLEKVNNFMKEESKDSK